jgi:ectoine hydroxylase-related dioxygenase (phytanoyl-CoA dioxygenase family)
MKPFDDILCELGVRDELLSGAQWRAIDEQGYLVLSRIVDEQPVCALRDEFERAAKEQASGSGSTGQDGRGTRQVAGLLGRWQVFQSVFANPLLLSVAWHVLKRPFRCTDLHGRDPLLGYGQQGLHADWGPRVPPFAFHVVTAIWLLDDFTHDNGGTRVVPGTHRLTRPIDKSLANPGSRHPQQIQVQAPAGSALVFNGHLWHSGMRNHSGNPRRTLQCSYIAAEHHHIEQPVPNSLDGISPALRRLLTGKP